MFEVSARKNGQRASISFPFRTPTAELPAGSYEVEFRYLGSGRYVEFLNVDTRQKVMFHANNPVSNVRGTEQPRLIFACGQAGCSLQRIWQSSVDGMDFFQKKLTPAQAERLAVVRMESSPSE